MKYGNVMATRKIKQKVTPERVEVLGFLFIAAVTAFVMNIALTTI